ncbi:NUDIX domain-containing protein [Micromonospora sp. NPDC049679]|uniref:NUDIX hydrolase n=1 Tax=Micromonospora sp. NPDC049679 TaxID=3155920 RepID=UPI00340883BA
MSQPRHSVSVAAVITDDHDRILVIQRRDNGAWQLPGGILELDETVEAGMCREVEEETGVTVEPVRLTGVYKNMKLGVVALVFNAKLTGGTPGPTDESAAVDWWTADRVAAEMNETFAARILDALNEQPGPAIRSHDGVRLLDL